MEPISRFDNIHGDEDDFKGVQEELEEELYWASHDEQSELY